MSEGQPSARADDGRPDPEAVLRRVTAARREAGLGALKVYLGFAPGVGKTCRMLDDAHAARAQGIDVVVGLVETHRRFDTANRVLGLEVLERRTQKHRGQPLDELDLDAVLARRPRVVLIDEFAHSNGPGCRHRKRWQDVAELRAAGIEVWTTLNIQHVESLNDVVAAITGVRVRETVPDAALDGASEVVLVDLAPEALLARLHDGLIYPGPQGARAAQHFFRRGNLLALRELALRRLAQRVDADVWAHREAQGVTATWAAGERILVAVGPAPASARLVRAAARLAAGLRCPWIAATVRVDDARPLSAGDRARLDAHLQLAASLGAEVVHLTGPRVSTALLRHARLQNVTRMVLGKPAHARWRDRLRGSLLDEVVRGSDDIEIQVIQGQGAAEDGATAHEAATPKPAPNRVDLEGGRPALARVAARNLGLAALLVTVTAGLAAGLRTLFDVPDISMLFLLAVLVAALRLGSAVALSTSALSVAAYDYFFVWPYFTFRVQDGRYLLTFGMLFGLGLVVSTLAGRVRHQAQAARRREARTARLYAWSRALAAAEAPAGMAAALARQATDTLGLTALVLLADAEGELQPAAASQPRGEAEAATLSAQAWVVARWSFAHRQRAGARTDTLSGCPAHCLPLDVGDRALGVLVLLPGATPRWPLAGSAGWADLAVFCGQFAVALDRLRLDAEARTAALNLHTESMRSALLATVSHDLRTPLAGITGAATTLRDAPQLPEATRAELLDTVVEAADRLARMVGNLLDLTRLEGGGGTEHREWVPVEEVVGSVLARTAAVLGPRTVHIELAEPLPLLWIDPVLFEQIFMNLLENVARYTPPETQVWVRARALTDAESDPRSGLRIEVCDDGPGVPAAWRARVFDKFERGPSPAGVGSGLGLAIARAIAEAHGGTLRLEPGVPTGCRFVLDLPTPTEAPEPEAPEPEAPEPEAT